MRKLRSLLVLVLLFSTMVMMNDKVDASAGRLQTASIITCNGVMYGKHTTHWHFAVKRGSYYYPSGSPVAKPCSKKKKKKASSYSYSYNKDNVSKKAVLNKSVNGDGSTEDQADKEKDDVNKDADTQSEISNFIDNDEKSQDTDKEDDGYDTFTGFIFGLIGGVGGSYFVRKKRNKKKKDDLTNW